MTSFVMNGYFWQVRFVSPDSPELVDRTDTRRVATTDPISYTIYLSNELRGSFLDTVLLHELGHCVMFSYGLLAQLHAMLPREYWIDVEEWCCNFIADYGAVIFAKARRILGNRAWDVVPGEMARLIG